MDILEALFDYQRFKKNARIEARASEVYEKYLADDAELSDDDLRLVAATGETQPPLDCLKPSGAPEKSDG